MRERESNQPPTPHTHTHMHDQNTITGFRLFMETSMAVMDTQIKPQNSLSLVITQRNSLEFAIDDCLGGEGGGCIGWMSQGV